MNPEEVDRQIAEVAARVEVLEGVVSELSDNVLKLESILDKLASYIIPENDK